MSVSALAGYFGARSFRTPAPPRTALWPRAKELHVPHAEGSIVLDGDADDPGWQGPTARTGAFVEADGVSPSRPHSEARFLWGDGFLYALLYAADEDIVARGKEPDTVAPTDDQFELVLSDGQKDFVFDISALAVVTDGVRVSGSGAAPDLSWNGHAHASYELDGTPNDPSDLDEEWVLEIAIPFEPLGFHGARGERIGLSMRRCDTLHDGKRVCGTWGAGARRGVMVLE